MEDARRITCAVLAAIQDDVYDGWAMAAVEGQRDSARSVVMRAAPHCSTLGSALRHIHLLPARVLAVETQRDEALSVARDLADALRAVEERLRAMRIPSALHRGVGIPLPIASAALAAFDALEKP